MQPIWRVFWVNWEPNSKAEREIATIIIIIVPFTTAYLSTLLFKMTCLNFFICFYFIGFIHFLEKEN